MHASRLCDVAATAEGAHELQGKALSAGATESLRFFSCFATGGGEIKFANREGEDAVIHQAPNRPDDEKPQRVLRFRKQNDVVDEAVGKGEAVFNPEGDAKEVSGAREQRVHAVKHRREKKKRKLDRLGDAGYERGQRGGNHDAADLGAIFRAGAAPHRNRRRGQAPHLEEVTAGHISRRRITGNKSRDLAVNFFAGRRVEVIARLEEERHVPDVMQSEWNQRALDHAVNREGERRLSVRSPIRKGFDAVADRRPDETQHRADDDNCCRGDDRHRALAGEEPEIGRQLYLIKAIKRLRCDQPDNDPAEYARIDGRDSHDRCRFDPARLRAHSDRGEKDEPADRTRRARRHHHFR